ncbi:hypothetical protein GWI72_14245 [Microvirga tunisiensis]|uniref:Uncharacterized protein n=1 Tax=Pannonibacter tanglangensis TaxID=2750084 RepID=A0A7X5F454_9HYPH|nr:hypothetical protein [Pannonibacter sp. XCT-53]NBN79433.1 hypothetical protein [Pannonibacter sp. XCT-53]
MSDIDARIIELYHKLGPKRAWEALVLFEFERMRRAELAADAGNDASDNAAGAATVRIPLGSGERS